MLSKDNQIYQFENMTMQLMYLDWMESYELCLQNAAASPLCDLWQYNESKLLNI